jgi:hypothetical protein
MKRWLIPFMVGCVAFAGAANAAVQQGDTELDFLGGWMTQNGEGDMGDIDALFLTGAIGYFVTDNIQVGAVAMGAWVEVEDQDVDVYGIGVRGKYHFMPTNQWVPYIGAQAMWADVDADDEGDADGTLWGPIAGLRYELNAYNDFFVEYQYHLWDGDISDVLDDGHGLFVGLIHQFK